MVKKLHTPLTIAVSARSLLPGRLEGIGVFANETLSRIVRHHPEHQFYFIFDRPYSREFIYAENVTPIVAGPPARHPLLFLAWTEWSVARILQRIRADVFLSPDGVIPLRGSTPCVPVLHDLNFEHYPQFLPFAYRTYYQMLFPRFARKAARIATVSEFSRNDICRQYGIPQGKVDVVYNSASNVFTPLSEERCALVRQKYSGGSPYFLFVGLLHPRKNIMTLLRAFDLFKGLQPSSFKLVIVGANKWEAGEIRKVLEAMRHRNDVLFTGRLPTDELAQVYAAAFALTYVPLFEGFGIPVLEAMHCDVPVITSATSSLPEVVGDAALLADPGSAESIAQAMLSLVSDKDLRNQLVERGRQRRNIFSWDESAQKLWHCVETALGVEA